jgi:quinol monooxygenase YgiN
MVIVQGVFRVAPEDRDAFLAQSVAGMVASRAEQGCVEYVMAADPVEADRVVLSERWASMGDLEAHLQRASERRTGNGGAAATTPVAVMAREIAIYEVASVRPLG